MKKIIISSAAALLLAYLPAAAQTTNPPTKQAGQETSLADCESNWKRADTNGDGMLSRAEISAAKSLVPTTLGGEGAISKTDFMTACQKTAQSSQE